MDKPQVAQKKPYIIKAEKTGKIVWCACGLSKNQPFCDASHRGTGFQGVVADVEEGKTYLWCGCKQSGRAPLCDGTHNRL